MQTPQGRRRPLRVDDIDLLQLVEWLAKRMYWHRLVSTGDYGDPPNYKTWGFQLAAWLMIQSTMKLLVSVFIWISFEWISTFSTFLFSMFAQHRHLELLTVMIFGPCVLNAIQFWIIDTFLKEKTKNQFVEIEQDDDNEP